MVFELIQHVIVTIVAIGALTVIVRRVAGVVRTPTGQSKCSSCPSAAAHGHRKQESSTLTLVRHSDRR
jgi:hypothetical protein